MWGYSSAGRAIEWHSIGQRFDPAYLHQTQWSRFCDSIVFLCKSVGIEPHTSILRRFAVRRSRKGHKMRKDWRSQSYVAKLRSRLSPPNRRFAIFDKGGGPPGGGGIPESVQTIYDKKTILSLRSMIYSLTRI